MRSSRICPTLAFLGFGASDLLIRVGNDFIRWAVKVSTNRWFAGPGPAIQNADD